jgi:transposase
MLKNIKTVYYYGEFGYFNFIVLGYLEEYFKNNKNKLVIRTYDDYFKILNFKFPQKFIQPENKIEIPNREKRIYHKIQNDNFNQSLIENGLIPLEKLLQCDVKDWKDARKKIKEIKHPLIISENKEKKYISILCRKRVIDLDRNLSPDTWMKIIQEIKYAYPKCQIVFHGLKEETIQIDNCIFCSDIINSIKYLNESLIFISSMSGFAQFASNCTCSILQIGPSFQMIPYNPFKKINIQLDRYDFNNVGNYLKQQSL